jgi:hypothetical protein
MRGHAVLLRDFPTQVVSNEPFQDKFELCCGGVFFFWYQGLRLFPSFLIQRDPPFG